MKWLLVTRWVSVLGDRVFSVAVIWSMWSSTRSPFATAGVVLAESVPFLLWAGVRRRLGWLQAWNWLAVNDALRAVLVFAIGSILALGVSVRGLSAVLVLVALNSFLTAIYEPAFNAVIPKIAVAATARKRYAVFDLAGRIARIAGPLIAAALLALPSVRYSFYVDAASFAVAGVGIIMSRRLGYSPVTQAGKTSEKTARKTLPRAARLFVASNSLAALTGTSWWLAAPMLADRSGGASILYSVVTATVAVAGIGTNLLVAKNFSDRRPTRVAAAGWLIVAVCFVLALGPALVPTVVFAAVAFGAGTTLSALSFSFYLADQDDLVRREILHSEQALTRTVGMIAALFSASLLSVDYRIGLLLCAVLSFGALAVAHRASPSPRDLPPIR